MPFQLVPELQYYFESFVTNSHLNFSQVPAPAKVVENIIMDECHTFVKLLFDDEWVNMPYDSTTVYTYYREAEIMECPYMARSRLMLYPAQGRYYIGDDSTSCIFNLFDLRDDDYRMLDLLLQYRNDSTAELILPIFEDLDTNLSKLIWLYLELKVYNDYSKYDNSIIISDPNIVLENAYETYVIENIFNFIAERGT